MIKLCLALLTSVLFSVTASAQINIGVADVTQAGGNTELLFQFKPLVNYPVGSNFFSAPQFTLTYPSSFPAPASIVTQAVRIGCFDWTVELASASSCGTPYHVIRFVSTSFATTCTYQAGVPQDEVRLQFSSSAVPPSASTLLSVAGEPCVLEAFIPNALTGGNEFGTFDPASPTAPLPVEYIAVSATRTDATSNTADVSWTIANQVGVDFYEVIRGDGKHFQAIGKISADQTLATTAHKTYRFPDQDDARGTQYYYIRHTDFDGQRDSSWRVALHGEYIHDVAIFPNPSAGQLTIQLDDQLAGQVRQIAVYDSGGRLAQQISVSDRSATTLPITLHDLPPGAYALQLVGNLDTHLGKSLPFVIE